MCWGFFLGNIKYFAFLCIIPHSSTLKLHRFLKSFLVDEKQLFILYSQCSGCRWPGDGRNQDINSQDIDSVLPKYYSFSTRRVKSGLDSTISPIIFFLNFLNFVWKCNILNYEIVINFLLQKSSLSIYHFVCFTFLLFMCLLFQCCEFGSHD